MRPFLPAGPGGAIMLRLPGIDLARAFGSPFRWHSRAGEEPSTASIPDGLQIAHRCDNTWCCQPLHLFTATNRENYEDSEAKGRRRLGPAKLTEKDVHYIRQLIYEGLGTNEIADHLGVSTANALVSSLCSQAPRTYPARLPIARE